MPGQCLACQAVKIQPPAASEPCSSEGWPVPCSIPSLASHHHLASRAAPKLIFSTLRTLPHTTEIYACEPQDEAEDAKVVTAHYFRVLTQEPPQASPEPRCPSWGHGPLQSGSVMLR